MKFEIIITSPPDRERLVAEIYYENMFWAKISKETVGQSYIIQFYPHPKNQCWEFELDMALRAIVKAKKDLENLDSPGNNKSWELP